MKELLGYLCVPQLVNIFSWISKPLLCYLCAVGHLFPFHGSRLLQLPLRGIPYQGFDGPPIFVIIISVHGVMRNIYPYMAWYTEQQESKVPWCSDVRPRKFIEYNEVKYSGRSGNYQISCRCRISHWGEVTPPGQVTSRDLVAKTCVRVQISRQSLVIWTQLGIDRLRNQADNASLRIPTDQVLFTRSRSLIKHNSPDFLLLWLFVECG